jgi:hypothetical protein
MQAAMGERVSAATTGTSLVPLDTLGGLAKASIAAGDKSLDKAEQHYKSAGLYLAEAKERVARTRGLTWPAFLIRHCPIGSRRADELIAHADGRMPMGELRAANATSKQKSRAAKSAGRPAGLSPVPEQNQQMEDSEAPKKPVYSAAPDPRLKVIGQITLKTRDANLSELKTVDDFFAKLLSKRTAGSLN